MTYLNMNKETLKLFLYLHIEIGPVFNCKVLTTESAIQGNTIAHVHTQKVSSNQSSMFNCKQLFKKNTN